MMKRCFRLPAGVDGCGRFVAGVSGCLLMVVLMCGCSMSKAKLMADVTLSNKSCPIAYDDTGGQIVSISYDEDKNVIVYDVTLTEEDNTIATLKKVPEIMAENIKVNLADFSDSDIKELVDLVVDAEAGITYNFKGLKSGDTLTVTVPAAEMKQLRDNPMSEKDINETQLRVITGIENAGTPLDLENGMVFSKVINSPSEVVYVYTLDESIYNLKEMQADAEENKEDLKSIFKAISDEAELLIKLNKNLVFRYVGRDSGEKADIVFTPDEMSLLI